MTGLKQLKVYATQPHPCSYLDDREAITLFIDPASSLDADLYSQLSRLGFRRSGPHIYKPHCQDCNACIPCRVEVDNFNWRRRFRRILGKNQDLRHECTSALDSALMYPLYRDYIQQRHADGDMYPPSVEQFESFLTAEFNATHYHCFYRADTLLAVAVSDRLSDGLSAIYSFYQPQLNARSLGSFMILWQLQQCQQLGLPYLYLGYWIQQSDKMAYKADYRPLQLLINRQWLSLR